MPAHHYQHLQTQQGMYPCKLQGAPPRSVDTRPVWTQSGEFSYFQSWREVGGVRGRRRRRRRRRRRSVPSLPCAVFSVPRRQLDRRFSSPRGSSLHARRSAQPRAWRSPRPAARPTSSSHPAGPVTTVRRGGGPGPSTLSSLPLDEEPIW